MLIELLEREDDPDRFPAGVFGVPPQPLAPRAVRSRWPVDDTAALFLLAQARPTSGVPVEVGGWRAFTERFDVTEIDRRDLNTVYGYFLNGGWRAVVIPYRKPLGLETLDAADTVDGVATVVVPGLYKDGRDADVDRAIALQRELVDRASRRRDRLVLIDPPPGLDEQEAREWRTSCAIDSWFAACYHPWIDVADESGLVLVPPSGHLAGLLAYNDLRYGVQKPPANDTVRGAVRVRGVPSWAGEVLNPLGVNLLLAKRGLGIVAWGARSMAPDTDMRVLAGARSLQLVVRLIRAGAAWIDTSTESPDEIWGQLHHDLAELVVLLRRAGVLARDRREAPDCVRREAEREARLDVALVAVPGKYALRLAY